MALLTTCNACERGDHAHHEHIVEAVPEGVIGGAVCDCRGECRDGRYKRADPFADMLANAMAEATKAR